MMTMRLIHIQMRLTDGGSLAVATERQLPVKRFTIPRRQIRHAELWVSCCSKRAECTSGGLC